MVAETLLIKHQLLILNWPRRRAPNLTAMDRTVMGLCTLFIDPRRLHRVAAILKPATLLRFHRLLRAGKYRRLFSSQSNAKPGPSGPSKELIEAIVEMKRHNARYGCPRIAQQLSKAFGLAIDRDVVRRVLAKYYKPGPDTGGGPSWLTFIGHAKDSLSSVDLFRCESITLNTHWVLVVMDQFTRRIIGFGVHAGDVNGIALCCMFNKAISRMGVPKYLSSDNDPLFTYHRWEANLRSLEIDEVKAVPYTPTSHPFVERLIGSVRRELLAQVFFWNTVDLERKLRGFQVYFNQARTHLSLDGNTPFEIGRDVITRGATLRNYDWEKHCGGLFELPMAA
jgi:putative transposase